VQKQQRGKVEGCGGAYGQPVQQMASELGQLHVRLLEILTDDKLEGLGNASQNTATTIGFFANLNKSLGVVDSIAISLKAPQPWDTWFDRSAKKQRQQRQRLQQQETNKGCVEFYKEGAASIVQAAGLLEQRIRTIKHSGGSLNERARAQSSVVRINLFCLFFFSIRLYLDEVP
jgi:hypothetical protein